MKNIFLSFILLVLALPAGAKSPYNEWREKVIQKGRKELIRIQNENALNDSNGQSDQNRYLVFVSLDEYPNGEFIKQRKGSGRGASDQVYYLLNEQKIADIDNTLRAMNNTSEIKTYALVVYFMPLEFDNEVPDGLDITDFFTNQKTDLGKRIAKPMTDEASSIVDGITSDILTKATEPTLYCGFVNFKVFKNDIEGLSKWVYYPRHSNVKFDEEYVRMLTSSMHRAKWPTGGRDKVDNLIDVIKNNNAEYSRVKNSFTDLIAIDNTYAMTVAIKDMSMNALSAFNIGMRLHILKVLSSTVISNTEEVLIINLINSVPSSSDADQLITAFGLLNDKVPARLSYKKDWCLLRCITDDTSDGLLHDNYNALIKSLIALCKRSTAFSNKVAALTKDKNLFASRTIYYNYNSFWKKLGSTAAYQSFPLPQFDRSTDYGQGCQLQTSTEMFLSYLLPNETLTAETLDALEPIVFVNQSDLGMLGNLNSGDNTFISPAIILKYADDKAWNQTTTDVTMATVDAASMATGYGEIKAGVTGLRKAWVLIDMFNSGMNLTLNATLATENPTVKKILDSYNLITGGVAITRMASGGIKGVFNLIDGKNVLDEKNIRDFLKLLDDGGEDALKSMHADDLNDVEKMLQRIKAEANAKGITDIEQQVDRILGRITKIGDAGNIDDLLKNSEFKKIYNDLVNNPTSRRFTNIFSVEEETALKFYTNKTYFAFNQALIESSTSADIHAIENTLNSALSKIKSSPGTYYRGIGKIEIDEIKLLKEGDEIVYPNFLSSTSEKEIAWRFFDNNIKKTGEAAFVEIISKNGKQINNYSDAVEFEILHHSKSRFRLKTFEVDENYIRNIDDVALSGAKPDKIKLITIVLEEF